MIAVNYQDSPDSDIEQDVVFSQEEAEQSLLAFYNQIIKTYFPDFSLLDSFQSLENLQKTYDLDQYGKCWLEDLTLPDEDLQLDTSFLNPVSSDTDQPVLFTVLTQNLSDSLEQEGVHLSNARIHEIVSNALWQKALLESSFNRIDEERKSSLEAIFTQVLLVFVGQLEVAVYLDDEYIDSGKFENHQPPEVVIDTAKMLAEKYQIQLIQHHFVSLDDGWSWTHIEEILQACGIMPEHKRRLLAELLVSEKVSLFDGNKYQLNWHKEGLSRYVEYGETEHDLVELVHPSDDSQNITLMIEDVVHAVEASENHWVCADVMATEISILDVNIGLHAENIMSLLR